MTWLPLVVLLWPLWLSRQPEQQSPIWRRRSLIVLISLLTARYLHWRITSSLNLSTSLSTGLSLLLLAAEAWLLLSGLLPLWLAWRRFPDRRETMDQLKEQWQLSDLQEQNKNQCTSRFSRCSRCTSRCTSRCSSRTFKQKQTDRKSTRKDERKNQSHQI